MAVRQPRVEPAIIDRIHQHRKQRKPGPPSREALSVVRGVVERSATVDDAIAAVRAIATAWTRVGPATRDAVGLLIAILELSDTVDDALATYRMLNNDGALLKPLTDIRAFVESAFPDARMRIVPGDEVAAAYVYVLIPSEGYPSFWAAHVRLRDWAIQQVPELDGVIHIATRPLVAHV